MPDNYQYHRLAGQLVRESSSSSSHTSAWRLLAMLAVAELTLALTCLLGDHYVFASTRLIEAVQRRTGLSERLVRACADSVTHASVAALAWLAVRIAVAALSVSLVAELACVGLLASLVDVDHFVAARSFGLGEALSLPKRPFLHNR